MAKVKEGEEWRGKVGGMTKDEIEEFLGGNPLCRLGCLDDDGWPYVLPCWYQFADGGFYIVPRERSKWATYIKNDPRVYICIDVPDGLRKVMCKGEAEILEEANVGGKWVGVAENMSLRYLGPNGPDYLKPTLTEPRWLIFVKPTDWQTWQGVDWAKKYKHSDW